jgi:FkbM family methyltransferase
MSLKVAVMNTPIYPVAREVYRSLFRRPQQRRRKEMSEFYLQFYAPDGVVFDVGANQGEYAEVFARNCGRVVAIEPNTAFRSRLEAISKFQPIVPVYKAIGDQPGTATLNICSTAIYSTLVSDKSDWITDSPDYEGVEWSEHVEVPVTTLDALALEYGEPDFVKIDVEGFEMNVLKGMTFNPRYVSFEFGVRRKSLGLDCLKNLGDRGYKFRPIVGRSFAFATTAWLSHEEARTWLESLTIERAEYGDMFAMRP